jgi:hypothetical protein
LLRELSEPGTVESITEATGRTVTLISGAQTFSEISIVRPAVRALVRKDGSMNIGDVAPREQTVRDEYRRQFGAEAEGSLDGNVDGSADGSALRRLIEQEKVSDEALRLLAQRRAARIKDQLVLRGGIADARLFLQDPERAVRRDARAPRTGAGRALTTLSPPA